VLPHLKSRNARGYADGGSVAGLGGSFAVSFAGGDAYVVQKWRLQRGQTQN
jgi:hypothetical protein